nr:hypothetical protein [uncultured Flavobacterium sp.]
MKKLKIPDFKDPMEAIRWVMLITFLPFILYMFFTDKPRQQVSAKQIYEEKYNDSYSGRVSEKVYDGRYLYKFHISTGRYIVIGKTAFDATEIGDTLWKKSKDDTLYIKMPNGALLGFDEVSRYRDEYLKEVKKLVE